MPELALPIFLPPGGSSRSAGCRAGGSTGSGRRSGRGGGDGRRLGARASTLAGNPRLPGPAANPIVAPRARRPGVEPGFGACLRIGVPVTLLTIAAGTALLAR